MVPSPSWNLSRIDYAFLRTCCALAVPNAIQVHASTMVVSYCDACAPARVLLDTRKVHPVDHGQKPGGLLSRSHATYSVFFPSDPSSHWSIYWLLSAAWHCRNIASSHVLLRLSWASCFGPETRGRNGFGRA